MSSSRALVSCGSMAVGWVLTVGLSLTGRAADDWPQWRGPGRNGVAGPAVATSAPPRAVKLDKAPPMLECTSPAVSRDRLVVRAVDGVTCYRMEATE